MIELFSFKIYGIHLIFPECMTFSALHASMCSSFYTKVQSTDDNLVLFSEEKKQLDL